MYIPKEVSEMRAIDCAQKDEKACIQKLALCFTKTFPDYIRCEDLLFTRQMIKCDRNCIENLNAVKVIKLHECVSTGWNQETQFFSDKEE